LDDPIGRGDAQFTRYIELEMAAKVGAKLTLSTAGARIVRMKQRYCPTTTANDWCPKMPPSCRPWAVLEGWVCCHHAEIPPNRFADHRSICAQNCSLHPPFFGGTVCSQKAWARMQKSSIERVSRILKSPRWPSLVDTWIVEIWHFLREVRQYKSKHMRSVNRENGGVLSR
jgi:hypothetical protein